MSWETAKMAIDFFLERSRAMPEVIVGFYGGEPMLEFELIKRCVEYTESQVEGKTIRFNVTSNGTILTEEIMDFLAEKNFLLSISLDGSKEEHDVTRKFANGDGSFDTVINNIKSIQKRYPDYVKNIAIMTTINPHMDLGCVLEYFSTSDIFGDKNILFNEMTEMDLKYKIDYSEKYYLIRSFEYMKMVFSAAGKLENQYVSALTLRSRDMIADRLASVQRRGDMGSVFHHSGPCLPGVLRLFVRVDGALFPCERVNEELDFFRIGTLDRGLDIDKIRNLLNIGRITESECKSCWHIRHCSICSGQIEFDVEPSKAEKFAECAKISLQTMFNLYELAVLSEFGLKEER